MQNSSSAKSKRNLLIFIFMIVAVWMVGCTAESPKVAETSAVPETTSVAETSTVPGETELIETPTGDKLDRTRGGFIVFENEANRDYNFEVYIMNGDGSAVTKLTDKPGYDGAPSLSPDLKKIAFASSEDGRVDIVIFDLEVYLKGEEVTLVKLTDEGNNYAPAWSPDGATLIFQSDRDGMSKLYQMNPDGSEQVILVDMQEAAYASWSPDGERIAFSAKSDGNTDIYIMNKDGTQVRQITKNPGDDQFACWSPDGKKIAFSNSGPSDSFDISVIDETGDNQITLITHSGLDEFPRWSPDGKQILFRSSITGSDQLTLMLVDGTEITALTELKGQSMPYDWKK